MSDSLRMKAIKGFKPGDKFIVKRTFTREDTMTFGHLTRDFNPVHYDERWCGKKGFDRLICHGLLVGSMICEFGGQVGWLATGMTFKFLKPVYFNDTIQCTLTITAVESSGRAEARAVFVNQKGDRVGLAEMTGRLPVADEKEVLQQIVDEGDVSNGLSEIKRNGSGI